MFAEAVSACLHKYADFTGRASRPEFWWFVLFTWIVNLGLLLVFSPSRSGSGLGVVWIASLALALPYLAAAVRRLHDTGRSGFTMLLGLIPLVGIVLLVFLASPGTGTQNRYGEPAFSRPPESAE